MTARENQKWLVLVLIGLCIAAIPIGLIGRQTASHASDSDSDSDAKGFMLKYIDHVKVVRLNGMIIDKEDGGLFTSGSGSAPSVLKQLRKALKNDHVKAILLRINSPGGTIATSQELHEAVANLEKKGKPVVVSMGDLAASGGYYTACAAEKIFASPGTLTGSIGVIMDLMNFKGLADKLGVAPQIVKSGQFKDIASPYRPMTPEEKTILQNLIMDSYDQFVTSVAEGRKMNVEAVKKIADGRVYSGRQALKLGLVDELGGYEDALDDLQEICQKKFGLKHRLPVEDSTSEGFLSSLLDTSSKLPAIPGEQLLPPWMSPKFYKQPMWIMQ